MDSLLLTTLENSGQVSGYYPVDCAVWASNGPWPMAHVSNHNDNVSPTTRRASALRSQSVSQSETLALPSLDWRRPSAAVMGDIRRLAVALVSRFRYEAAITCYNLPLDLSFRLPPLPPPPPPHTLSVFEYPLTRELYLPLTIEGASRSFPIYIY